jgi:outer membrane receptor protein involved in Fe transport
MRFAEPSSREADLFSAELTASFGFAQLVSATSYSEQKIKTIRDQTDLLLFLSDSGGYGYENFPSFVAYTTGDTDREQFTEELRLVSTSDGPLSWIVGGFYNKLESVGTGIEYTPGLPAFFEIDRPDEMEYYSKTDLEEEEKAAYGEIGYRITDAWQVTVGGRYYDYTVEQTNVTDLPLLNDGPFEFSPNTRSGVTGDSGSLFKFNTSYEFTDDLMAFVTVSEGYRLGGFNAVAPCPDVLEDDEQYVCAMPNERQFLPDKTLNKEIGIRSQWFNRSLTMNAAIYHIDWEDVQVAGITENGAVGITSNGAEAVSQGVEFSLQASLPMDFTLMTSYTYTDAQLTKDAKGLVDDRFTLVRLDNSGSYLARYGALYNAACDPSSASYASAPVGACPGDGRDGDRLPGTPKHKGSVYLGWTRDFSNEYTFRANYGISAQSNVFTKVGNRASGEALAGYATHSFNIGVEKGNWMVSLFGENIWDKYAETSVTNDSSFVFDARGGSAANPTTSFAVRRYNKTIIRPQVFGLDFRMKFGM